MGSSQEISDDRVIGEEGLKEMEKLGYFPKVEEVKCL